jgi:hypothetical protein
MFHAEPSCGNGVQIDVGDRNMADVRQELRAYRAALPGIVGRHDGQYVVIHGEHLARFFDSYEPALDWAYDTYGLQPFFVKRVSLEENVAHFTRDLGPCRR